MTGRPRSTRAINPSSRQAEAVAGRDVYGKMACAVGGYAHDRGRLYLSSQEGLSDRSALDRGAPTPLCGDRVARRHIRVLVLDRVAGVSPNKGLARLSSAARSTALRARVGEPARRTRERRCLACHRRIEDERDAARRGLTGGVVGIVLTQTRFGEDWGLRAALVVVLAGCLAVLGLTRKHVAGWIGLLAAAAFIASLAWAGHGAAAEDVPFDAIHLPADILHLLAAGAWLGALLPLVLLLAQTRRDSSPKR